MKSPLALASRTVAAGFAGLALALLPATAAAEPGITEPVVIVPAEANPAAGYPNSFDPGAKVIEAAPSEAASAGGFDGLNHREALPTEALEGGFDGLNHREALPTETSDAAAADIEVTPVDGVAILGEQVDLFEHLRISRDGGATFLTAGQLADALADGDLSITITGPGGAITVPLDGIVGFPQLGVYAIRVSYVDAATAASGTSDGAIRVLADWPGFRAQNLTGTQGMPVNLLAALSGTRSDGSSMDIAQMLADGHISVLEVLDPDGRDVTNSVVHGAFTPTRPGEYRVALDVLDPEETDSWWVDFTITVAEAEPGPDPEPEEPEPGPTPAPVVVPPWWGGPWGPGGPILLIPVPWDPCLCPPDGDEVGSWLPGAWLPGPWAGPTPTAPGQQAPPITKHPVTGVGPVLPAVTGAAFAGVGLAGAGALAWRRRRA